MNNKYNIKYNLSGGGNNIEKITSIIPRDNLNWIADTFNIFKNNGVTVIKKLITPSFVNKLYNFYKDYYLKIKLHLDKHNIEDVEDYKFSEVASRGFNRIDMLLDLSDSLIIELVNKIKSDVNLNNLLSNILGHDYKIIFAGIVLSLSKSYDQEYHRDGGALFDELQTTTFFPSHCINIFIPLHELNYDMGLTCFKLGSHLYNKPDNQYEVLTPLVDIGDGVLFDYKTVHGGLKNISDTPRYMMYLTFSRKWFVDDINFSNVSIYKPPKN